ncbi:MAG: RNase P subunit p30 family protein [Candidatus Woesearchaeota archaeon]
MIDVVFPENNENEFFVMAKRLGYSGLVLVYSSQQEKITSPAGLKVRTAVLAEPVVARQLKKKGLLVFVKSSERDRIVLEQGSADILFNVENTMPKDYMHQRGSGLNHIMCGLARKNNVAIGFGFSNILSASGVQRARLLGRMMQNIMLCKKYGVKMVIGSFANDPWQMRSPHDLQAFFRVLGMHPVEAKKALSGIPL